MIDTNGAEDSENAPSHIVGIGASAGGLEAIERFFKAMPPNSGVAFVVIQHLSPHYKSLMAELLSKHTLMPVHRAEDGMRVERDSVYLIPPNRNLRLFHGRLLMSEQDRDARGINLPIDIFFRSLAEDRGRMAVAVILSGTGSDGSSGIRAIKEELGMVMVQSEETAAFDGMPRSAIATGLVDFVLPAEDMPRRLLSYLKHPYVQKDDLAAALLTDEDGLTRIFALLRERKKIDFTYYKPSTIVRRIERRMAVNQIHELNDYVRYVDSYPVELNSLHKDLLIGVTSFFRDPEAFRLLGERCTAELRRGAGNGKLRIWVAGCSTGEEAYSIAIVCQEAMDAAELKIDVKIFATDVDRDAILDASAGVFAESAVAQLDAGLLSRYFYPKENGYQVSRQIREMVVFAQHNLVKDPPFTNIDLISCRNLLIYLQPVLQKRVLELFNFALNPRGILFLGSSETTGDMAEYFEPLDQKWRLYRCRGRRRHAGLSEPALSFDANRWRTVGQLVGRGANLQMQEEDRLLERLVESVAGDYLPFCMVISETMELMHVVGAAENYLRFPTGKVINDVSKLANRDLAIPLTTGLQKVFKTREEMTYSNIHLREGEARRIVNMRLKPLATKKGQVALAGVFIEEVRAAGATARSEPETYDVSRESQQRISDLENELQFTRENLQATVEELETSNEELQATNEELLASNEELQSTNEELQSVNEELYTVNAEYQSKITELTEANNDLDNLLTNTRVATLFVDENLDVRRFTPEVSRLFRVMENDVGRPLSHLAHGIDDLDIQAVAARVQATASVIERHVRLADGSCFLLRALPYQIAPETYSGVVLTFVDVSRLRRAEAERDEKDLRLETLLNAIPDGYVLIDADDTIKQTNPALKGLLGYEPGELTGENVAVLMFPDHAEHHDTYVRHYLNTRESPVVGACRQVVARHKDGSRVQIALSIAEMQVGGQPWFVGLMRPLVEGLPR